METLAHLAEVALQVEKIVGNLGSIKIPSDFHALRSLLDDLQGAAPLFQPVVEARVNWFMHGLKDFEENFVERVEADEVGWESFYESRQLLMAPEIIDKYLTRRYLGSKFAEVFERVEDLYCRLASAKRGIEFSELWQARHEKLRLDLLKGRL